MFISAYEAEVETKENVLRFKKKIYFVKELNLPMLWRGAYKSV